jgi:RNA recognition motif-containing protein
LSTKIYVGNLDYGVTSDDLGQLFAKAGNVVDAVVISDRYSGRSKGFGFVEFEKAEESAEAIKMFNGKDHNGRELVVNEARPKEDRGDRN